MSDKTFREFKQQPPRPPLIALDRLGKAIEPGHLLLVMSPMGLMFEVLDVRPVLNPAQPGAMQVTIQSRVPVQMRAAVPFESFVIIGETDARKAVMAANNGSRRDLSAEEMNHDVVSVAPAPSGIVLTDLDPAPAEPVVTGPVPVPDPVEE